MEAKIISYSNVNKEGVTLQFNQKVSINGHLKTDEWRVSWDKISNALLK